MNAGPSISILAVDDEPFILELVCRCLDDQRATVTEAASGKEALEYIAKGAAFDLLIVDMRMPDMQGDELARRIRSLRPNMKVLYLTGYADNLFDAKRKLWAGEAYLDKPFTYEGLREAIALLLFGRTTL